MRLLGKLLRAHISMPQMVGYIAANLIGMTAVLLSVQFYADVAPMLLSDDGFLGRDMLVVSKRVGATAAISGSADVFSSAEEQRLRWQPFAVRVGEYHSSQYRANAVVGADAGGLATDIFLDAVPDEFVDAPRDEWNYTPGDTTLPMIMPRSYLAIYNFGFAQSRGLPQISEGVAAGIDVRISISAAGHHDVFRGKVVGFSSRATSILVPLSFISWSNARYAPDGDDAPTRLIVETVNPTDPRISEYTERCGYEVLDGQAEMSRAARFLRIAAGIVFAVGLLISVLSLLILMLSIYLLVEKNSEKIENLLLMGYSPAEASRPYQRLTVIASASTLVLSLVIVAAVQHYYLGLLSPLFPYIDAFIPIHAALVGIALFAVSTVINSLAVRRKVEAVWGRRREQRRSKQNHTF